MIYISIALLFAIIIVYIKRGTVFVEDNNEMLCFIFGVIAWPITSVLLAWVFAIDFYRKKLRDEVLGLFKFNNMYELYTELKKPEFTKTLNSKTIKTILHAHNMGALYLGDNVKEELKNALTDQSFEEFLLKTKESETTK